MTVRGLVAIALAPALAAVLAACGESASRPALDEGSQLVDKGQTPYVNALELARDGSFLLTTNRGFWRVAKDGSSHERVTDATVRTSAGSSTVGTFLEIFDPGAPGGELYGSGHPDDKDALPPYLGLMRSDDDGRTWRVVSRLGAADLHVIRQVGTTLFAWDAVLSAVLVTEDGGRTFKERFTPQQLVLDMVVDPRDPKYLLISTEQAVYRSEDQGERWRPFGMALSARFAWLDDGTLYRAVKDGTWTVSRDRGETWEDVGKLPGEPWKIRPVDEDRLYVALADGSIAQTQDGGQTWDVLFDAP